MDDDTLYTIGALAERTGVTVKTIRFYSDSGIVPPSDHSPGGYRLYDLDAVARLELVRTLRDLGIDLATIRRVLARETTVPEVAAAHAQALDIQIRMLRSQRAVLRAVARRDPTTEEMNLMHKVVKLSEAQRHRLIHDFVDDTFGAADANPELVEFVRASLPELPDDPEPAQVEAWIELAELVQDSGFRAAVRRMAEYQARERAASDTTGLHHELTEAVREQAGRAVSENIAPDSEAGAGIVEALATRYADTFGKPDDAALRQWILERLDIADDARVQRYWQLIGAINGWPPQADLTPVFTWFAAALRAAA